jgi:hypothetical protein
MQHLGGARGAVQPVRRGERLGMPEVAIQAIHSKRLSFIYQTFNCQNERERIIRVNDDQRPNEMAGPAFAIPVHFTLNHGKI